MSSVELQGLNIDHWETVFNQYDHNNDGKINLVEFKHIIESREYKQDIPEHVVKAIFRKSDSDRNHELDLKEFKQMILNPQNEYYLGHIKQRAKQYINFVVAPPHRRTTNTQVESVDGVYEDEYSCWPPRLAMITLSLIIIILFLIDAFKNHDTRAQGPVATLLLYDPHRRKEAWRYLTYMFVHVGATHLIVNIFVQIMLGLPLEMVHGGLRVIAVYIAGVVAGSLGTSVVDPAVKLAGASGGVYSLITAHLATIIMNWSEMTYPLIQLFIFVILIGSDVGTAIYNRYVLQQFEPIGYAAHFCGALAGLLVGITVLKNLAVNKREKVLQIVALVIYLLLMGAAIVWNAVAYSYYPVQYV